VIATPLPPGAILFFVFLIGLIIGSFLNVCIYRLPRGESVVTPRSHCPGCNQPVAAYDNIPLVSYLILGGRCRRCRTRISPVYFFVELATGLLFLFLVMVFGPALFFVKFAVFGALLVVLVMTDWQTRLLPDRVTFPGMALGFVFSLVVPVGDGAGEFLARLCGIADLSWRVGSALDAALGALAGGGLLYGLAEIYFRLRHREGMGFGDVKMMAMVGFFLGPKLVFLTILLASVAGSVIGPLLVVAVVSRPRYYSRVRRRLRQPSSLRFFCGLTRRKMRTFQIPFGCFLGVAALFAAVWGNALLYWYLSQFS